MALAIFLRTAAALAVLTPTPALDVKQAADAMPMIIDTDIGIDIDDSWAIALSLLNPKFSVKLIVTASDFWPTLRRQTQVLADFLTRGHQKVPIGTGVTQERVEVPPNVNPKAIFTPESGFNLTSYAGPVYDDGVAAMVRVIREQQSLGRKTVLLAIAPFTNLAHALTVAPDIAKSTVVVAMGGSLAVGEGMSSGKFPEMNIKTNISAAQTVFKAPWAEFHLVPLDATANVQLKGPAYAKLLQSKTNASGGLLEALLHDYRYWAKACPWANEGVSRAEPDIRSSDIYDAVAAFLSAELGTDSKRSSLNMVPLMLAVNESGFTEICNQSLETGAAAAQHACSKWASPRPLSTAVGWRPWGRDHFDAYVDGLLLGSR
eukprot:TRINITY_DN91053_c0_g1_i1.p1 TRINITY_DN91053_c0_g1~~TRINITY_DN91053_c0_g1_i1.p1  ORF type:complete len:375 (-),score=67.47 TRINITY_DN91053_c0_g1_i1:280-1404(-)